MNLALWRKAIVESRALLAACAALLFGFQWVFVWVTSQVKLPAIATFLSDLPEYMQNVVGIPIDQVATTAGRIALSYIDPVVLVATGVWAIARGSDAVSGEIGRGTMEMLLAQPVRRIAVLWTHAGVTILGAGVLGCAAWLGTFAGISTVVLDQHVDPWRFVPSAINVAALTFFLAGVATMASSWDSYRHRTVGLMGGFYVVGLVLEMTGKMVDNLSWLRYLTFLGVYEPQVMVTDRAAAWEMTLNYNGVLLGLGALSYIVATVIFCRRDLPAPL